MRWPIFWAIWAAAGVVVAVMIHSIVLGAVDLVALNYWVLQARR